MIILAIDLGKFNSVACVYDTATNHSTFQRFETERRVLHRPHLDAARRNPYLETPLAESRRASRREDSCHETIGK